MKIQIPFFHSKKTNKPNKNKKPKVTSVNTKPMLQIAAQRSLPKNARVTRSNKPRQRTKPKSMLQIAARRSLPKNTGAAKYSPRRQQRPTPVLQIAGKRTLQGRNIKSNKRTSNKKTNTKRAKYGSVVITPINTNYSTVNYARATSAKKKKGFFLTLAKTLFTGVYVPNTTSSKPSTVQTYSLIKTLPTSMAGLLFGSLLKPKNGSFPNSKINIKNIATGYGKFLKTVNTPLALGLLKIGRSRRTNRRNDIITLDGFKAQGMESVGPYRFISAHKDGANSRIYAYDKKNNFLGAIELNTQAHVGGLTYDDKNHLLFVTGSKSGRSPELYTYNLSDIAKGLNKKEPGYQKIDADDIVSGTKMFSTRNLTDNNMSSIEYGNSSIFTGTYDNSGRVIEMRYKYDKDKNAIVAVSAPKQVTDVKQGIQGMEYDEKTNTLMTSTSSFLSPISRIRYTNLDTGKEKDRYVLSRGLQDIQLVQNDLVGVQEYGNQNTRGYKTYNLENTPWPVEKFTKAFDIVLDKSPELFDLWKNYKSSK